MQKLPIPTTSFSSFPPPPLIQYVILRLDLKGKWPLGALISQVSHCSISAIFQYLEHENVSKYLEQIQTFSCIDSVWIEEEEKEREKEKEKSGSGQMRTVVLGVKDEEGLISLSRELSSKSPPVLHYCWREEPELVWTSLATIPYPRGHPPLKQAVGSLRLFN